MLRDMACLLVCQLDEIRGTLAALYCLWVMSDALVITVDGFALHLFCDVYPYVFSLFSLDNVSVRL